MWQTCPSDQCNKVWTIFDDALADNQLDMLYHRTKSRTFTVFGLQCRNCGMCLMLEWGRSLTEAEAVLGRQIVSAFLLPQPINEDGCQAIEDMWEQPRQEVVLKPGPRANTLNIPVGQGDGSHVTLAGCY